MHKYIIKRLLLMIVVVLGISLVIFVTMDMAPGDLAMTILGEDALPEDYAALREELGLNDPLLVRYGRYMWGMLHGDIGYSYVFKMDVWELYMQRLPNTIALAIACMLLAHIIAIPLGIYTALKRGSFQDNVASALAMIGIAAPNFWVGLMLIIVFSLKLGWFHSGGLVTWKDLVLPAFTVGLDYVASLTRTTRSSMIDVLSQDYLMLARAKGVGEKKVITKHAFKNALIPIITVSGGMFKACLGGAVVTETVFAFPGVCRLVVDSITGKDFEVVTGTIILTSIFSSLVLLAVDILYAYVDPRIKARYSK